MDDKKIGARRRRIQRIFYRAERETERDGRGRVLGVGGKVLVFENLA